MRNVPDRNLYSGGFVMMYLHYCRQCRRIHILSGHKPLCPACDTPLKELAVSFADYSDMNIKERGRLLELQIKNDHA